MFLIFGHTSSSFRFTSRTTPLRIKQKGHSGYILVSKSWVKPSYVQHSTTISVSRRIQTYPNRSKRIQTHPKVKRVRIQKSYPKSKRLSKIISKIIQQVRIQTYPKLRLMLVALGRTTECGAAPGNKNLPAHSHTNPNPSAPPPPFPKTSPYTRNPSNPSSLSGIQCGRALWDWSSFQGCAHFRQPPRLFYPVAGAMPGQTVTLIFHGRGTNSDIDVSREMG